MSGSQENAALTLQAAAYWKTKGGHLTLVRRIICDWVDLMEQPFTAEDAWREVCKIDKGISMASVYRTLSDLLSFALIKEITRSSDQRLFIKTAAALAAKGLLICRQCKRVIPLGDPCLALREAGHIRGLGFQAEGMQLHVEANCEEMQNNGTCSHCKDKATTAMPSTPPPNR